MPKKIYGRSKRVKAPARPKKPTAKVKSSLVPPRPLAQQRAKKVKAGVTKRVTAPKRPGRK